MNMARDEIATQPNSGVVQMLNHIVEDRVHNDRDRFIKSINADNICRLASSYHNNDPCAFFKPPTRGSYNICFFVRFCSRSTDKVINSNGQKCKEGDSWVVRVPLSPCLAFGAHDKLEREVATMQLIAEKTTIPIPQIHAYSLAHEKGPYGIASFIILEYIDGRTLFDVGLKTLSDDQRRHFYDQLADIYIQLRRLEFSSIGVLSRGPNRVEVQKKPVSIDINVQELEGLQPSSIQAEYGGSTGVLTSASDYVSMLLHIARNAFEKGRTSVYSEDDGKKTLYHLYQFFQFAKEKWLNPTLDGGPFVLVHGDLNPYNIMVNENIDIVALLDWEWSRVVPLQFFIPPTWLTSRGTDLLAFSYIYSQYTDELNKFRTILRDRELKMYGEELLSNDWARVHENGSILATAAIENWTDIDFFATRYLDWLLYKCNGLEDRIEEFMAEDPARQELVARKVRDWIAYQAEREHFGIKDSADDDDEIEENERNNNKDNQNEEPAAAATWSIVPSMICYLSRWWLAEDTVTSSKIGQFLPKFAVGGATIALLAGTSYIISRCIIRSTL